MKEFINLKDHIIAIDAIQQIYCEGNNICVDFKDGSFEAISCEDKETQQKIFALIKKILFN